MIPDPRRIFNSAPSGVSPGGPGPPHRAEPDFGVGKDALIHPRTELRFVDPVIGHGVFATAPIPKGTITYVKDPLEIEVSSEMFVTLPPLLREITDRYSYIDNRGLRIMSWDHGRFVNHRCDCNTMSTGYGFEIAVRDIRPGEEITDEYGMFNIPVDMSVACGCRRCRKVVTPGDLAKYHAAWDRRIRPALRAVLEVPQPLWELLDQDIRLELGAYLQGRSRYRSVLELAALSSDALERGPGLSVAAGR